MRMETDYGVPSVAVHADVFARLVDSVVKVNGMPRARRAYVPTPVLNKTPDELRAYVEGADPTTGKSFMETIIGHLTTPVAAEDLRGVSFDRSTPRLVGADTEENLHRLFRDNNWTDFFPIVLPTEEKVAAMLAGTSRKPDEVVGQMRPTGYRELWEYTVEKVAVNAVMAGAEPAYFPVILALASTGITARQSSTSSMSNLVVVNGPIRHELSMNSGLGALGPYNHANATIGRAYSLLSQNLQGGSVPGESYMGAQGNPYGYSSVTFAENEEKSPWLPFHVQQGFDPDESTVSTFYAWGNNWSEGLRGTWEEKMKAMFERPGSLSRVHPGSRPDRCQRVPQEGLRHQGEVDRLGPRQRDDPGRSLLGQLLDEKSHAREGRAGTGAVCDVSQGGSRRPDPNLRERPDPHPGCRRLEQRPMEFVQRAAARSPVPQQTRRPVHGIDRAVALKLWR